MPPAKKSKARKNGLVLTAKNLRLRAYESIHNIPHGYRQDTLHALLEAAASLAASNPEWYKAAITGKLKVSVGR